MTASTKFADQLETYDDEHLRYIANNVKTSSSRQRAMALDELVRRETAGTLIPVVPYINF